MQKAVFRIRRFNPEKEKTPHYDKFQVKIDEKMSVLDTLEDIKHEQDATLTFRRSCRSGICGSCAMKINRLAKLACKTKAVNEISKHGEVLVEPMENMRVIRDLVVDMGEFWREIYRGKPWLVGDEKVLSDLSRENLLTKKQMETASKRADCIMCGACFSDCVSRVFDKNFTGPASLAKIERFVADPREKAGKERIDNLVDIGVWACTHCYFCWSQCPQDVRPVAAISALRVRSVNTQDKSQGARHVKIFSDSIRKTGMLNEATVFVRTMRLNSLKDVDLMLLMARKGKAPSPLRKPIPKIEEVRLLYKLTQGEKKP
jgi:succinate dehydrogenase / fumarate reductase iron-sulfur subunit